MLRNDNSGFPMLPVVDPAHTSIFGMVGGAIRLVIAECIFDMFGAPLLMLVMIVYRAIFLFMWFEIGLLALSGFSYDGEFRGWSASSCFKGFVDGNVVMNTNVPVAICNFGATLLVNNKHACGKGMGPIFGTSFWTAQPETTDAQYAEMKRSDESDEQIKQAIGDCQAPYWVVMGKVGSQHGDARVETDHRWQALTDAERASMTELEYFHRIQPELEAERGLRPCAEYAAEWAESQRVREAEQQMDRIRFREGLPSIEQEAACGFEGCQALHAQIRAQRVQRAERLPGQIRTAHKQKGGE